MVNIIEVEDLKIKRIVNIGHNKLKLGPGQFYSIVFHGYVRSGLVK